jgi:hypothetical protein
MARYAPSLNAMVDLTSFSSEERFSYSTDGGFRVAIPRITEWVYHPRAKISELKAYLFADLKLTRGGRLSQYQPERPVEQDYRYLRDASKTHHTTLISLLHSWWLGQLIHYGLELQFTKNEAKLALRNALISAQISVPDRLLQLERDMRRSCNRRKREERSKHVAAIYTSTLPVARSPQTVNESASASNDSTVGSAENDYEVLESDNGLQSAGPAATTRIGEVEDGQSDWDSKQGRVRSKVTIPAVSEAASSTYSSSDEPSTQTKTNIRSWTSPSKFSPKRPVAPRSTPQIKTEPVKRLHINLEEQLLDVVPIRRSQVQSKPREVGGHQVVPPKSTELQEKEDIYNPKMTRDEYLKKRGELSGSGSGVNTKKRSYQAADDFSILDEADDFLNSPSRWREELRIQPTPVTPSHSKRTKISSNSHHDETDFSSASSEPTGQFNQHNPKGLSRLESPMPITRHLGKGRVEIPQIEATMPSNERNTRAADQIPRGEPSVSSVEYYAEHGTRAVRMESNRKISSTFAAKGARKAESEAAKAVLSRFTDIIVDAAPDVISSPPTLLDNALNKMLTTQSRIAEGRVEKPTKQRIVGLSRQSGGGPLPRLAPESTGSVRRMAKSAAL